MSGSRDFTQSNLWVERAGAVIPGGAHTYAKGSEQYPEGMAPIMVRGDGAKVWDVDGNSYIEYGSGLRAVSLGHGHPRVNAAVVEAIARGTNFVRPTTFEVETAEVIRDRIPSAEMVKFGKNGSDVTTAAVKIARAATGRDMVAVCSSDPFLSVDDWFIGVTTLSGGIPKLAKQLTVKFAYNDLEGLQALFALYPGRMACVIMEAENSIPPSDGYLPGVKDLCRRHDSLFILDEMLTGYRWARGGAQELYGLSPDLSTFGKAMANGYSVSALVGRRDLMRLGTLGESDPGVFLLSLTHGAESHALAAAIATAAVYDEEDVISRLHQAGAELRAGIEGLAVEKGIEPYFGVSGRNSNLVYWSRDADGNPSQAFRTLFLQETIERGLLAPSFVTSLGHGQAEIAQTIEIVGAALDVYAKALVDGIGTHLRGRPVRPVFPKV